MPVGEALTFLTAQFWAMFDNGKPDQREKIERALAGRPAVNDEDLLFRGDLGDDGDDD